MVCRICGNAQENRRFTAREMMFGFRDEFQYFECSACGCLQIEEFPREMSRYYPSHYYSFQAPGRFRSFVRREWARNALKGTGLVGAMASTILGPDRATLAVKRAAHRLDSRILDVGCGSGELLLVLQ